MTLRKCHNASGTPKVAYATEAAAKVAAEFAAANSLRDEIVAYPCTDHGWHIGADRERIAPEHHCHATGCEKIVQPRMLMCMRHWRMVPKDLQVNVWHHFRPGQEIDKRPSYEYMVAQRAAVNAVAAKESRPLLPEIDPGMREFLAKAAAQ